MQRNDRVFNIVRRTAVVVNDRYLIDRLQKRFALHIPRPVYVHNDQQRVIVAPDHGVLRADEHVLIFRQCFQAFNQFGCHRVVLIDHDMHRLSLDARCAYHTGSRANRVHIAVAVAHHQHLRGITNQLAQRVGDHAAFHLGSLFHLFTQAAVKLKHITVFDDRLIAAA